MASGNGTSGNTAWNNSVRSRLYLETNKDDQDQRTLTTKKSNYGPSGGQIVLRYTAGAFIVEPGTGYNSTLDRKARASKADRKFLELLAWHADRDLTVCPNRSVRYAPKVFSVHQNADGLTKGDFASAMTRLLDLKTIKVRTTGPASKSSQIIDLANDGSA